MWILPIMMMFTGTETLANPMRFICTETLVTPPLQDNQKLSDEIRRLLDKVEALEAEKLVAHPQTLTHERQMSGKGMLHLWMMPITSVLNCRAR